jgi:hypothetical protein
MEEMNPDETPVPQIGHINLHGPTNAADEGSNTVVWGVDPLEIGNGEP